MKPRVFVSYARRDGEAFAAGLTARIEANGIPVWRDRDGLRGNEGWWRQIEQVLADVEFMVVVLTPGAVESATVRKEWHLARRERVCIFPVIASDALPWHDMPQWIAKGHCYDLRFEERKFFNDLNTRCTATRVPFMAGELPENHVARPALFDRLLAMMLDEDRGTPKAITTALRGAGGFGKTTLARAFCHDVRTRYLFDDGILWVTLGEKPVDPTAKLDDLIFALTEKRSGFSDAAAASAHLRELLEEKHALIVIDDVWQESHARPFLVGGRGCAWLLTTRMRETLPLGAEEIQVDAMASDEAVALLASGVTPRGEWEASALAPLAARLGEWPLLLGLVNRVLVDRTRRRGQSLRDALAAIGEKFDRQGLEAFDLTNAGARDEAVAKTMSASLEALAQSGGDALPRLEALAVFGEDAIVPVAVVARLWDTSEFDAADFCDTLFGLSLLLAHDLTGKTIRLHDVIRGYLLRRVGAERERALHRKLVESYRRSCAGQWHRLPDDGYAGDALAHHLLESREREAFDELISREWRAAQLARVGSDRAFSGDADLAIAAALQAPVRFVSFVRAAYARAAIGARASRIPPETLGAMAMLGKERHALDDAALVHDSERRSRAYRFIGTALARRGLMDQARDAFAHANDAIHAFPLDGPRAREWSELSMALADAGEIAQAKTTALLAATAAQEVSFSYWKYEDMRLAAEALSSAGESEMAETVAGLIVAGTDGAEWPPHRPPFDPAAENANELATAMVASVRADLEDPEADDASDALAETVSALISLGRDLEALDLAAAVPDDEQRSLAFGAVAFALALAGKPEARRAVDASLRAAHAGELLSPDELKMMARVLTALNGHGLSGTGHTIIADFQAARPKSREEMTYDLAAGLAAFAGAAVEIDEAVTKSIRGEVEGSDAIPIAIGEAQQRLRRGEPAAAAEHLAHALSDRFEPDPSFDELRDMGRLAEMMADAGATEDAARVAELVIRFTDFRDPSAVALCLTIARILHASGDARAADDLFAQATPYGAAERDVHAFAHSASRRDTDALRRGFHAMVQAMTSPAQLRFPLSDLAAVMAEGAMLLDETFDFVSWAIADPAGVEVRNRARNLAEIAAEISRRGFREQAFELTIEALLRATRAGRDAVAEVLGECAGVIAELDAGETLARVYQEIRDIRSWMTPAR